MRDIGEKEHMFQYTRIASKKFFLRAGDFFKNRQMMKWLLEAGGVFKNLKFQEIFFYFLKIFKSLKNTKFQKKKFFREGEFFWEFSDKQRFPENQKKILKNRNLI